LLAVAVTDQDGYARDSQNPAEAIDPGARGGSGTNHYYGSLTDKGTMTLQLLHQQPDGALVLTISEQSENIRRAPAAECVVNANTNVICDPNKTVYPEEYTLLHRRTDEDRLRLHAVAANFDRRICDPAARQRRGRHGDDGLSDDPDLGQRKLDR
jgi:hypothetical protein